MGVAQQRERAATNMELIEATALTGAPMGCPHPVTGNPARERAVATVDFRQDRGAT